MYDISPHSFLYANLYAQAIIINMELLNSITLFEAEYLEIKYYVCVIIWFLFFLQVPDLKLSRDQRNFALLVPYYKYISSIFFSIEFRDIKRIFPIESVKFAFTHYEHSTVEGLEIQIMSLILQETCSEQTSLSKHSSVTLIEVRSSATNSNIQKSTGKIRILPVTKATFSLVQQSLNFLSPILIHFFPPQYA